MLIICLFISTVFSAQCADKTYWNQQSGACIDCPKHCATCWSEDKCTSCDNTGITDDKDKYYLNSNYKCVQRETNENCETWDGLYCVECKDGYYLNDMKCDNECSIVGCAKCNVQKCFKCSGTLTLYEDGNGGQECINCASSDNDEKCGRCPLGKYFDVTTFQCANCRENCARCTTGQNCYLCEGDFALDNPVDPLSECVPIEECTPGHYYGNHCELCNEGFFVKNGKCAKCPDDCARCLDENTCVECKQGSTLNSQSKCDKDVNCIRSSDLMGCIECNEGYYLGSEGKCVKCGDSCASCLNEDYCFRCNTDYYFENVAEGRCKPRDETRCKVSDQYGCLQCAYDLKYDDVDDGIKTEFDERIEENKILNGEGEEIKVSITENTHLGFYLPYKYENGKVEFERECKMCDAPCRICEYNSHWCTGCNDGFEMEESPEETAIYNAHFGTTQKIHVCKPKSKECNQTEMGYCTQCIENHFLAGIKCIQCDESCGQCVQQGSCSSCKSPEKDENGNELNATYWRSPKEEAQEEKGLCHNVTESQMNGTLLHCTRIGISGCLDCESGYYKDSDEGDCFKCGKPEGSDFECETCGTDKTRKDQEGDVKFKCDECSRANKDRYRDEEGRCMKCSNIDHCIECEGSGCTKCEGDYELSNDICTKVHLEIILPLVAVGLIIIIIIIVVIVILIWRQRQKTMKEREKEIKPFKVSNEVEMALLSADNENFPLKTSTWKLDFGHAGSKVNIDTEYEQIIQIMNPTRKSYFFEILAGASHRYELTAEPMRFTLKADYAIEVKFTIKMLCTAIVKDEIGIVAMDMDEEVKETAKLTILIESDLSTKLDHTELKLQMPAIGEGAFGMVFVGTYRGQKVAVKKMKARNLTEEQEKEFKHEVNMLTQYRHACIVNLVGAVYTEGEISIVTEFADYGSLSKVWSKEKISYDLKIKFMEDAVVALSYLHENSIIHRDVKGENVLVYSLNPHSPVCGKLTDFGTCRNISERALQTKELSQGIGTPTYMAPECLGNNDYSYSADVYSFSIVLYETFTEIQAYVEDPRFNQPWMIPQFVIEGKRLERPNGIPDNYWQLIEQCWSHEAEERPTFPQIYATLASWGNDICHTEMSVKAEPINLPPPEINQGGDEQPEESSSSSSSSDD